MKLKIRPLRSRHIQRTHFEQGGRVPLHWGQWCGADGFCTASLNTMRTLSPLLLSIAIWPCFAQDATSPDQAFARMAGQKIYGLVATTSDIPEAAILNSPACAKRDAACMASLQQAAQIQFSTVTVYDTFVFAKVLVPREAALRYGDIIQIEVKSDLTRPPIFVSMGARLNQRGPACDWIDGTDVLRKGGILCNGWSYKSIK